MLGLILAALKRPFVLIWEKLNPFGPFLFTSILICIAFGSVVTIFTLREQSRKEEAINSFIKEMESNNQFLNRNNGEVKVLYVMPNTDKPELRYVLEGTHTKERVIMSGTCGNMPAPHETWTATMAIGNRVNFVKRIEWQD